MIPWIDIVLVLIIITAAVRGYQKGFIGAIRGFIGSLLGFLAAWLTAPVATAWAESALGLKALISDFLFRALPDNVLVLLTGIDRAAVTLQELKEKLHSLPIPQGAADYLRQALEQAAPAWHTGMTPENVMAEMLGSFAHTIIYAITFLVIWGLAAAAVRWFLGLFTGKGGIALFGAVDGIMGMVIGTAICLFILTLLLGAAYPVFLIKGMEAGNHPVYQWILESRIVSWMAYAYQTYFLPWLA